MNFYFNYFASIGREHINCLLSTVHTCKLSFPEKGKKFFSSFLLLNTPFCNLQGWVFLCKKVRVYVV